ncbi:MAG: hypothetical protein A4E57_00566 [Syntrophorhabdaceae bacterium PtaU1.Bin034]|nr:MAG: hypothetical protein A4E57_00566 [Syntrophorhabdaceae bacterium PtaU1.Bin034]
MISPGSVVSTPDTQQVKGREGKRGGKEDGLLTDQVKGFIERISHGLAAVGVAPADRFDEAPPGHGPTAFIPDAKAVVVIGLPIVEGLMNLDRFMEGSGVIKEEDVYTDKAGTTKTWSPRQALRNHIERRGSHEIINIELQTMSMYAAIFLENAGFKSIYLPTTYGQTFSWPGNINRDLPRAPQWFGPFSHRHAAVAAGLGRFGLSNLLLTPQHGPRNRFVSIITAAPLRSDPMIRGPLCLGENCSLCITNCVGRAFGEVHEFKVGGQVNRMARIDRDACLKGFDACYKKCMTVCPVGRKTV